MDGLENFYRLNRESQPVIPQNNLEEEDEFFDCDVGSAALFHDVAPGEIESLLKGFSHQKCEQFIQNLTSEELEALEAEIIAEDSDLIPFIKKRKTSLVGKEEIPKKGKSDKAIKNPQLADSLFHKTTDALFKEVIGSIQKMDNHERKFFMGNLDSEQLELLKTELRTTDAAEASLEAIQDDLDRAVKNMNHKIAEGLVTPVKASLTLELTQMLALSQKIEATHELPLPKKLPKIEHAKSDGFNLVKFLRRFFTYYIVIRPSINKNISGIFKGIKPSEYRREFTSILDTSSHWIQQTKKRYPELRSLYSDAELQHIYRQQVIDKANQNLKSAKLPILNQKDLRKFEIEQIFRTLHDDDYSLDYLEKSLFRIHSFEMPFENLADITITDENQRVLADTWNRVLSELYSNGQLDKVGCRRSRKEHLLQAECAAKFISAIEHIPDELKVIIDEDFNFLQNTVSMDKLNDLIISEQILYNNTIKLENLDLIAKQRIYQQTLIPLIKKELIPITNERHGYNIALILADESSFKEEAAKRLHQQLKEEELKHFSISELEYIVLSEIEHVSIQDFHFTSKQVDNLYLRRQRYDKADEGYKALNEAIKAYNSAKEVSDEQASYVLEQSIKDLDEKLLHIDNFSAIFENLTLEDSSIPLILPLYESLTTRLLSDECLYRINNAKSQTECQREILFISLAREGVEKLPLSEEDSERILKLFQDFELKIKNTKAMKLIALSSEELQVPWYEDLMFGDDVLHDLINNEFGHRVDVSKKVMEKLFHLERTLYKIYEGLEITDSEQQQLLKNLKQISQIVELPKFLAKYKVRPSKVALEEYIPSFLKRFIPDLNKKNLLIPAGIREDTLDLVSHYTNLIKQQKSLQKILPKAKTLLKQYHNDPSKITPKHQLTYRELAKLTKIYRLQDNLDPYIDQIGLKNDKHFTQYRKDAEEARKVYEELMSILKPDFASHYKDGDLVGFSGHLKESWTGRPLEMTQRPLKHLLDHGLTHGAKLYHANDDQINFSHINAKYINNEVNLFDIATSEMWRINITSLIPPSSTPILARIYGIEWGREIQKLYHEAEKKIHSHLEQIIEEQEPLEINDAFFQVEAGLADYPRLANLLGFFGDQKIKGHLGEEEQDFTSYYEAFLSGEIINQIQICSEFATTSTLAALIDVNKGLAKRIIDKDPNLSGHRILKELQEKGVRLDSDVIEYLADEEDWDPETTPRGKRYFGSEREKTKVAESKLRKILKKVGYPADRIELVIRVNNDEIFDLPYDKRERMQAIHPGRMISLLEKKKCVSKVERPPAFKTLIKEK